MHKKVADPWSKGLLWNMYGSSMAGGSGVCGVTPGKRLFISLGMNRYHSVSVRHFCNFSNFPVHRNIWEGSIQANASVYAQIARQHCGP
jgi:hypothetical protein